MEPSLNILFLNGAGGTGKSSIIQELRKITSPETGVWSLQSPTRKAYEQLGISNETDSLTMDNEMRIRLQLTIMENERELLKQKVAAIKADHYYQPNTLLVVDRGPMDRMAYYLLTMMQCAPGDVGPFFNRLHDTTQFLDSLEADHLIQMDFNYPVPWQTEDTFRQTNYMQTLALSLMTSSILQRYAGSPKSKTSFWYSHDLPLGNAETRAAALMKYYTHFFGKA